MINVKIKKGICNQKVQFSKLLFENEPETETVGEVKKKINRFFDGEEVIITIASFSIVNRLEYLGVEIISYEEF